MDESNPSGMPENQLPAETSLAARLTNVVVAPTEAFDAIKGRPVAAANWVVPLIMSTLVGMISVWVIFSQPGVMQGIRDAQEKAMQAQVDAGKMTQKDADAAMTKIEQYMTPTVYRVTFMGILLVVFPVMLFLSAAIFWLLGNKVFVGRFEYMKAVEALGLAMTISVLGIIVRMLLVVISGKQTANFGPILLINQFDPNNKLHAFLAAVDVPTLWYLAVLALGLARLSGAGFVKAALWIYGLWYGVWAVCKFGPMLLFGPK
jgi:hypothetical protein